MPVNLDGTDDWISLGDNLDPGTLDMSYGFWFKSPDVVDTNDMMITKVDGTDPFFDLFLAVDGSIFSRFFITTAANNRSVVTDATGFDDDVYHHIITTIDRSAGTIKIYVDGNDEAVTPTSNGVITANFNGAAELCLGARDVPASRIPLAGPIFEFALWHDLLTQADVTQLYTSKVAGMPLQIKPTNLKTYLPLDDLFSGGNLASFVFNDMSGNSITGTGNDTAGSGGQGFPQEVLSYQPYIMAPQSISVAVAAAFIAERGPFRGINRGIQRGM